MMLMCSCWTRRARWACLAPAALAFALASAVAPLRAEDAGALSRAWAAASARDWAGAAQSAALSGPMAQALVRWAALRAGQGSWAEYRDFLRDHPDWPQVELIQRRGDAVLTPGLPVADVLGWFGDRRPTTLVAEIAYLDALTRTDAAAAQAEAARFWHETPLTAPEQASFLASWGTVVTPQTTARVMRLLDKGEWAAAELSLPLVPAGPDQALAAARIATQARRDGVDALILGLPSAQQGDAGLALDRFLWRAAARQPEAARSLMLERSTSAEALRDPARWASRRIDYARERMRAGDWATAEELAARHFLPASDAAYADLEWLAGYAALRAGAPDRALTHFDHLPEAVDGPISTARAWYWRGRALEAAGNAAAAEADYRKAATHPSAWYGQIAAARLGVAMPTALARDTGADTLPDWRGSAISKTELFQAGEWLIAVGDPAMAQRFFLQLSRQAGPEDIARMARLMLELHRPWDALRLAKAAAAKGGIYPAAYFPLTGLEHSDLGIPTELVLAIARRESEFNPGVSSGAGARGLMQVMPETARQMAARIGEPFDPARLTTDAAYNARLGAAYLDGLRQRFGGSVALVAAGYNAGPGRSARWLSDFGDLRQTGPDAVDPVDWVEMIPFDETRIYVMRVAESLPIYRARIQGRPVPFAPLWDLRGAGLDPPLSQSPLLLIASDHPRPRPPIPAPELGFGTAADAAAASASPSAATAATEPPAPLGAWVPSDRTAAPVMADPSPEPAHDPTFSAADDPIADALNQPTGAASVTDRPPDGEAGGAVRP